MKLNLKVFKANGRVGDFSQMRFTVGSRQKAYDLAGGVDTSDGVELSWQNDENVGLEEMEDRLRVIVIYGDREFMPKVCGGFGGNTERRTSRVSVGPGEGRESSFVLLFCLSGWSDVLEFSIHLFMTLRVDPVTNVVDAVSRFVDRLTLPAREKKQLETDLQKLIQEIERDLVQARASIVVEETRGNWLAAFLATFGDA